MDRIENDFGVVLGVKSSTADHLYKSLNMSVRGRDIKEGLTLSKAAGTYKGEAEVGYLR